MSSFSNFVGHRIKKYRKSRGYTIEQFSAMINKSKATLSKYENGAITIDVETLYDISNIIDTRFKDLMQIIVNSDLCELAMKMQDKNGAMAN